MCRQVLGKSSKWRQYRSNQHCAYYVRLKPILLCVILSVITATDSCICGYTGTTQWAFCWMAALDLHVKSKKEQSLEENS